VSCGRSERDLRLMRRLDELDLEAPYYGARNGKQPRRKVLAWRLSNTLTADVYVAALEEALKKFRPRKFLTRNSPVRSGSRH
jgi:hypothetical protein